MFISFRKKLNLAFNIGIQTAEKVNNTMPLMQKSKKPWKDYDQKSLLLYLMKNSSQMDCSFLVEGKDGQPSQILESYSWILADISPVLKRILGEHSETADGLQRIPVRDTSPDDFNIILSYAHTKILGDLPIGRLFNLYNTVKRFEVESLLSNINFKLATTVRAEINHKWIDFFELAYTNKQSDLELFHYFEMVNKEISADDMERSLLGNVPRVLKLNSSLFYELTSFIKSRYCAPLLSFKLIEAYLKHHKFTAGVSSRIQNSNFLKEVYQPNVKKDILKLFLQNIDFTKMGLNDFTMGPKNSDILDEEMKDVIFKEINKFIK